jgi:hypothetical protein
MKKFIPATAAAVALAAGVVAGSAFAFPPAPPAPQPGAMPAAFGPGDGPMGGPTGGPGGPGRGPGMRPRDEMRRDHQRGPRDFGNIEQRADRMKERLKITEAQKPQWDALVDVMQKQAKAFAAARAEFWQKRANGETPTALTLPERMAQRDKAMETRLNSQREFTAAFAKLYDSMNDDQKKRADDLLSGRHHRR